MRTACTVRHAAKSRAADSACACSTEFGLDVALHADAELGRWAAVAVRYGDAFRAGAKGSLMTSLAGAARDGALALQGDLGGSGALDAAFSSSLFWHAHAGFARWQRVTPFVQFSGQHWVVGGAGTTTIPLTPLGQSYFRTPSVSLRTLERRFGSFEGADLVNLGAHDIAGRALIAGAAGIELRFGGVALSAAYEHPLTAHQGLLANRVTTRISLEL